MELGHALQIIDETIKNKEYKEIINNYISKLTQSECVTFNPGDGIKISSFDMKEYASIRIQGPEFVIITFNYHNEHEKLHHQIIFELCNNAIKIDETVAEATKGLTRNEQYVDNKMLYYLSYEYNQSENTYIQKEMVFNDENLSFSSEKKMDNNELIEEYYSVNKVESPYVYNTEEDDTSYSAEFICDITKKQYDKVTTYIVDKITKELEGNPKTSKLSKLKSLILRK